MCSAGILPAECKQRATRPGDAAALRAVPGFGLARLPVEYFRPRASSPGRHSAPVAQLDRASGFEPEGRGFESLRARHKIKTLRSSRVIASAPCKPGVSHQLQFSDPSKPMHQWQGPGGRVARNSRRQSCLSVVTVQQAEVCGAISYAAPTARRHRTGLSGSGQEPTLLGDVHCSALRSLKSVHVAKDRLPPRADSVMARRLLLRSALRGT